MIANPFQKLLNHGQDQELQGLRRRHRTFVNGFSFGFPLRRVGPGVPPLLSPYSRVSEGLFRPTREKAQEASGWQGGEVVLGSAAGCRRFPPSDVGEVGVVCGMDGMGPGCGAGAVTAGGGYTGARPPCGAEEGHPGQMHLLRPRELQRGALRDENSLGAHRGTCQKVSCNICLDQSLSRLRTHSRRTLPDPKGSDAPEKAGRVRVGAKRRNMR